MTPRSVRDGAGEVVRATVAGAVRSLVSGSKAPEPDFGVFESPAGDPGLFGPDSVAWRVGADAAMLIGGVRALLMQTVHPLAMAGIAEHSDYRTDPWGRLQRTANYVSITTFGSTAAAHAMIRRVTAVHKRVSGTAPDGRAYSALDPDLLCWVHVTEVDSFVTAVQTYGGANLTQSEVDQYFAEMAALAYLLGARDVPESRAECAAYYERLTPELSGSTQAREAVRFLLWPPVPSRLRLPYLAVVGAAIATLPADVKAHLWLPDVPLIEKLLVEPAGARLGDLLGWALGDSPLVDAARRRCELHQPDGQVPSAG